MTNQPTSNNSTLKKNLVNQNKLFFDENDNSCEKNSSNSLSVLAVNENHSNIDKAENIENSLNFLNDENIFEFIKTNLKERESELFNFQKIFQSVGINNIPQSVTVDKFSLFLNKTIQSYLNNDSFISSTLSNFCTFLSKEGYTIKKNESNDNLEDDNKSIEKSGSLLKKRNKDILNCPHVERKHYAKNMCNNCYHRQGRNKKAWLCPHTNKSHYAKGRCQNCYSNVYLKNRLSSDDCKYKIEEIREKDT